MQTDHTRQTELAVLGGTPVRETLLTYGRQLIDEEDIEAVVSVLRGDYLTTGPQVSEFEQRISQYVGSKYAVAFANGTAALHGACFAAEIGPGDEVITSPMTFAASANCVLYMGGTPVFSDIDGETYNIDPAEIERHITDKTKAIIPVDFTGQPADMQRIKQIADRYQLIVIEDAAHALGATHGGQRVGTLADMTMFSFHPVKPITTAEGGIITTDNPTYYEKLLQFRSHGVTRDPAQMHENPGGWYYEMQHLGYNYRLTDVQAALGSSQVNKLDDFIQRRREIADRYNQAFKDLSAVTVPYQNPEAQSGWHLYVLRLNLDRLSADRTVIFDALSAENIGVNVHYIPVYYHPYYRDLGFSKGLCPTAEQFYEKSITLPLFPAMSDEDVADVIKAVHKVIRHYLR
jgi:perosamine synthetase